MIFLTANELVSVQPMAGPVGLAFSIRYNYSNIKHKIKNMCQHIIMNKTICKEICKEIDREFIEKIERIMNT